MIEEGKVSDAKIEPSKKVEKAWASTEKPRTCPRCLSNMKKVNFAYDSNVLVDKCNLCGGIWTDSGELLKLSILIKGNPILDRMGYAIADANEKLLREKYPDSKDVNPLRLWNFYLFPRTIIPMGDDMQVAKFPLVVTCIILLNSFVCLFETIFLSDMQISDMHRILGFIPSSVLGSPIHLYSTFTSMFIHAGFMHLATNMIFLWVFADNVEDYFGHIKFIGLYFFFGFCAKICYTIFNYDATLPLVGASGAVAGTMGAYMALYPRARIKTLVWGGIYEIPAVGYLGIWFLMQIFSAYISENPGKMDDVAWTSHIGGFASGVVSVLVLKVLRKKKDGS